MIDITVRNFEAELVNASFAQPVLLDIWAPWCGPCKTLGPVLESLEIDYDGRFKLGKLNADEQPEIASQLSQLFGVRSIPFCVLFKDGQPVDGFVGALPEAQVRQFLDKHVPSAEQMMAEEDVSEAQALLEEGDADSALMRLEEALNLDPANDAARADLIRALLSTGRVAHARHLFEPVAGKTLIDSRLSALGHWLAACERAPQARKPEQLSEAIGTNKRDFEARFELAQLHMAGGRFTEALDELLEIVLRDKAWKDELARKTYVAILDLMAKPAPKAAPTPAKGTVEVASKAAMTSADPVVDQYRRKLSMALF